MTGPLKSLLSSNTYNGKWILVKLTSNLWQVALQIPKRRSCHDHFWQNLLSNSPARDLVVTLMITSDNFLRNNLAPTESPQSSFCHVNGYLWYIISYGIHFLTPQCVSGRLPSKSIISLFKSPMDFPDCHVNNIPLTIPSKCFFKEIPTSPQNLEDKSYFPQLNYFFYCHVHLVTSEQ